MKLLKDFEPYQKGRRTRKGESVLPAKNILTRQPGCYVITHVDSGKMYVGSSVNLAGRITGNLNYLKDGKHKNKELQKLFTESPNVEVIVKVTEDEKTARELEQSTVDQLVNSGKLCNVGVKDVMRTRLGISLSEESRVKLSAKNSGRKASLESREKMSLAHRGKTLSEDLKRTLSDLHKVRMSTDEGKATHARVIEKLKHPVMAAGKEYSSKSEAARALGVDVTTIMYRCNSERFTDYFAIKKGK